MSGWLGGITIRRMDQGQVPILDHLCTRCGFHRRVTTREHVRDYLNSNPITTHRTTCQAKENNQ